MTNTQDKFAMLCANDCKEKYDYYRAELKTRRHNPVLRRLTIDSCLMYRRHYRTWLDYNR
ncbi:hypothetical protein XNC3_2420021 [Xenorhabdus nematophila F1]|nr:hypothetical protein XNC3_2420021 [Xenorhabdus nematophila F1]